MGLTLVATLLIQGPYLILLYALIVFFSFIAREKGFFFHLFRLGWQDWQKLFHTAQSGKAANPGSVGLSVLGVSFGFLLSYFLPFKPYSAFLVLAMFIGLIVLIRKNGYPLSRRSGHCPFWRSVLWFSASEPFLPMTAVGSKPEAPSNRG